MKNQFLKKKTMFRIKCEFVKYWTAEFKSERTKIFDKDRPRPPNEVTTEMIEKIYDSDK